MATCWNNKAARGTNFDWINAITWAEMTQILNNMASDKCPSDERVGVEIFMFRGSNKLEHF